MTAKTKGLKNILEPRMVDVNHLSFSFGGEWTLKNLSFTLDKGDYLFIHGPSGAGKTTLLRLLYGDLPVKRGHVHIADYHLNKIRPWRMPLLRRDVAFVFQDFKILHRKTVFQNVSLALQVRSLPPRTIERRVRAVLRSLQIEHKAGERCDRLSGGEQQRVAICRAIVTNPKVLLADEPTGNLDPDLARRLMVVFNQFHSFGTTVIVATHSKALMKCQPKAHILELGDGAMVNASWLPQQGGGA